MYLNLLLEQPDVDPQSVVEDQALRATPLRASTNFRASQSDARGEANKAARLEELVSSLTLTSPSAHEPPPFMSQLRRNRQILADLNISALTAVAYFLSKVRETTLGCIERTYHMQCLLAQEVKWILTVPARWDDSAK